MAGGHARRRRPGGQEARRRRAPLRLDIIPATLPSYIPWDSGSPLEVLKICRRRPDRSSLRRHQLLFTASQADILAPISSLQHAGLCLQRVRNHVAHSRVHADEMPTQQYYTRRTARHSDPSKEQSKSQTGMIQKWNMAKAI